MTKRRLISRVVLASLLPITWLPYLSGCGGGGGDGARTDSPIVPLARHHGAAGGDGWDEGLGITLDLAGRILISGRSENTSSDSDMVLWRYNPDGSLDSSFGAGGIVIDDGAAGGAGFDGGTDISVDGAGRILVAGSSTNGVGDTDMVIWRYGTGGSIDPTFGSGGTVVHDGAAGGNSDDVAEAMTLDASGRILVTGESTSAAGDLDMVIWRYNPDGTADISFGVGGVVVDALSPIRDVGSNIGVDTAGRIVVTGHSGDFLNDIDMVIWRFDSSGSPDVSFGGGGVVTHNSAAGGNWVDEGRGLAFDSQGRILVSGSSFGPSDFDMVVWRYDSTGTLDTSFGGRGWIVHDSAAGGGGDDRALDILVDPSGGIVVAGWSEGPAAFQMDVVVWRYSPDGSLESLAHRNTGAGAERTADVGHSMILGPSGDLFIAGFIMFRGGGADMTLWRYR